MADEYKMNDDDLEGLDALMQDYPVDEEMPGQTVFEETQSAETEPAEEKTPKKHGKLVGILIAAAVCILAIAAVIFWFAAGRDMWQAHLIRVQAEKDAQVLEINRDLTAEEIADLDRYVNLQSVDLTNSTAYEEIIAYMSRRPDVKVKYFVPLGAQAVEGNTETLRLDSSKYAVGDLTDNLKYLPKLRSLYLENMTMPVETYNALQAQYPLIQMGYSVKLCGESVDWAVTELNLSRLQPGEIEEAVRAVSMLTMVETIELMDGDVSELSPADVVKIMDAAPKAGVHYTFDLFGKTVSTDAEEIIIENVKLSDADEETLRDALKVLKNCKRFVLDMNRYYRISHETMAKLREEFRDQTKVVWRIWFATYGSCLTDRDILRFVYHLSDSNCSALQYCEDVEYIDFGHNEFLTDISWVSNMKKLKAIIISGSSIKSLEPFAECESLEFLEAAYCGYIDDVAPLAGLPNLKYLNVSYTKVADMSPLDDMELAVVVAVRAKLSQAEKDRLIDLTLPPEERKGAQKPEETTPTEPAQETKPTEQTETPETTESTESPEEPKPAKNTLFRFTGNEYGYPWRYEKDGHTKTAIYEKLCEVFHYPNATETTH